MPLSFYILALLTLASATAAMTLRNLVHCALALAGAFIGIAGIFLQLHAPFLAFAQILVYVGAVAILIVFAILLTRNSETQTEKRSTHLVLSLVIAALLGGALVTLLLGSKSFSSSPHAFDPEVAGIGKLLMTTHVVPLQIAGVMLTAALIGAVIIAMQEKPEPEPNREGEVP